jgi:nitrogen fixation NifU-like protein
MTNLGGLYSDKVMQHFRHPKNMGEMKNADGEATVGNPICGDVMRIFIRVDRNKIKDVKFQTLGCGAAIATSSIITEMAKGKTLTQAGKIDKQKVIDSLDGLPPAKIHCSVLAADALKKAIENYRKKK